MGCFLIHALINKANYETSWPGLRTQKGSHRASQEGPWLGTGQKSNTSREKLRAEFTEDIERVQIQTDVWDTQKGKERKSHLCLGSEVFIKQLWSGACVLSGIQELVKTRTGTRSSSQVIYSLEPGGPGMEISSTSGLQYTHVASPGYSHQVAP